MKKKILKSISPFQGIYLIIFYKKILNLITSKNWLKFFLNSNIFL